MCELCVYTLIILNLIGINEISTNNDIVRLEFSENSYQYLYSLLYICYLYQRHDYMDRSHRACFLYIILYIINLSY